MLRRRRPQIELPNWADVVKTGTYKELAPYDPDWYYIRAASMARKLYLKPGIGVGKFKKIYGAAAEFSCCSRLALYLPASCSQSRVSSGRRARSCSQAAASAAGLRRPTSAKPAAPWLAGTQ